MTVLNILYHDEFLVAINKPHGLMVHKTPIAADADEFALQLLRKQIGRTVYPVHRIDRKTGGILLFALDKQTEINMQRQFMAAEVRKKYLAIVRGHTAAFGEIDYPIRKENGALQTALTNYATLKQAELDIPFGNHSTSRYSLVEATPATGRMHQLRKHFSHIFHPIIGDRTHGCNKQNKLFTENWNMNTMLLHASEISFKHPCNEAVVTIVAPVHSEFARVMQLMGWD